MTESQACVAMNLTDRIGGAGAEKARAEFGSYAAAWENLSGGAASRSGGPIDVQGEYTQASKYGISIVTKADAEYPEILRHTQGAPLVLYVKGSVEALSKPGIAIVGTRRPTSYGLEQARKFAYDLASDGWSIISGLALGIDAAAHSGALDAGGVTVGVLGSALDRFYPERNRALAREIVEKGGAVISQFPFGRGPDTQTFPIRNHVVAALSEGVLAVECPLKSGTLITTSTAADIGRQVMAVPGSLNSVASAGCNMLIRDGAVLVRNSRDVNEAVDKSFAGIKSAPDRAADPAPREVRLPAVTAEEALLMGEISEEPVTVDELVERTGLAASKVNSLCMMLRVKDRVRFLPGNRVALPRGI